MQQHDAIFIGGARLLFGESCCGSCMQTFQLRSDSIVNQV